MTKPAVPPVRNEVVEIDAMDGAEWESGQRTPQASDANLAELVRKTAAPPEPPARVQTVARERAGTQLGAPAIPRPPNRARTEPPGPPPKPVRAQTAGGGAPAASARATRVPDIPAGPAVEPRQPAAPVTSRGIDFSLPVTATSPAMPAAPAGKPRSATTPASGGIDFSLPVTASGETGPRPVVPEPRRPPTQTPVGGVDFSLPVTASGETGPRPVVPEPRRPPTQTPVGGVDFSLPVTATGEAGARPTEPGPRRSRIQTPVRGVDFSPPVPAASRPAPAEAPGMRPLPTAPGRTGFSMPAIEPSPRPPSEPRLGPAATAISESGARLPAPELPPPAGPPPSAGPPRTGAGHLASPFAEPSRVGLGHNASPASGAEPNTAWPPRPVPHAPSAQPPPRAAPDPAILAPRPSDRDGAGDADQLKLGPSRRLWWIGGGIASAALAAVIAAVMLPGPEALRSEASGVEAAQAGQAPGPRRDSRSEQPVDRAAADLRERVRLARDAAAAGVPTTLPAADHRPGWPASDDPALRSRSDESEAVPMPRPGKKPHKVIVDYSARPDEPAPPSLVAQSEEDPAIGLARNAYTSGNQRLFVGDLAGAVRAYREALELYPGYVGGYRGLGLAYEQLGDQEHALVALRAYVAAVPNARDIVLIRKRIVHLQRR